MFGFKRPCENNHLKRFFFICSAALVFLFGNAFYAEAILYDWNTGNEGFVTVAPDGTGETPGWEWQEDDTPGVKEVWGVKGIPTAEDYEYVTMLAGTTQLTDLDIFLDSLTTNISDLIITVDVWFSNTNYWEGPPIIDLLLSDSEKEYRFSAELGVQSGWQEVQLFHKASWVDSNQLTDLFVAIETWRDFMGQVSEQGLDIKIDNLKIEPVPEPATMLLLGSGLVGLAGFRRKFRKK